MRPGRIERQMVDALFRVLFAGDRAGNHWTPPEHLAYRWVQIPTFTGRTMAGLWFPLDRPRGTVLLAHPDRRYGKHWFVREGWVEWLLGHGFEVLAFDFPGYGGSRGVRTYVPDHLLHAARFARSWSGGRPLHVIGLSFGAFAAANAAPRLSFVDGLVLESPYATMNEWFPGRGARRAMRFFDRAFPRSAATIQADRNIANARTKRILIALGEQDEVTPPRLTERFALAAPADRTRLLRVPDAGHLGLFRQSAAYRNSILELLGAAGAGPDAPALTLQPDIAPRRHTAHRGSVVRDRWIQRGGM